jgi:hypothetical protein
MPEARGHAVSRRALFSSLGTLIVSLCCLSPKTHPELARNAQDDLLIVNGWIVKRSQLVNRCKTAFG